MLLSSHGFIVLHPSAKKLQGSGREAAFVGFPCMHKWKADTTSPYSPYVGTRSFLASAPLSWYVTAAVSSSQSFPVYL